MALSHTKTPRVYIAVLAEYNAGELVGQWYELDDYDDKDELWEAVEEANPDYEEFAVHDHENCVGLAKEVGTDWELLFEMIEWMRSNDENEAIAFAQYAEDCLCDSDTNRMETAREHFHYTGSASEVGAQASEGLELTGVSEQYFSYERYGRDILIGMSTYSSDGTDYHFCG